MFLLHRVAMQKRVLFSFLSWHESRFNRTINRVYDVQQNAIRFGGMRFSLSVI